MNLTKLYVFHRDKNPAALFFVWKFNDGRGWGGVCKKCCQSTFTGSSNRVGAAIQMVLTCGTCRCTKKFLLDPLTMEENYKLGSLYRDIKYSKKS